MTANEKYQEVARQIESILGQLRGELIGHATDSRAMPDRWDYVGSIEHVRNTLAEAVSFLGGVPTEAVIGTAEMDARGL